MHQNEQIFLLIAEEMKSNLIEYFIKDEDKINANMNNWNFHFMDELFLSLVFFSKMFWDNALL
jgi:hypothetical protein